MAVAREGANVRAVDDDLSAIATVLDLVNPLGALRHIMGKRGTHRRQKPALGGIAQAGRPFPASAFDPMQTILFRFNLIGAKPLMEAQATKFGQVLQKGCGFTGGRVTASKVRCQAPTKLSNPRHKVE